MTTPANNPARVSPPKLKASIDSRSLPIELFGSGRSRHQRKLVYNYLATWANPDGTNAYPSLNRIARENGFTRRGVIFIIQWLSEHCLLKIAKDRSSRNTNAYTVLFSEEDQERCRAAIKKDAKEQKLSGQRDKAHQGRVLGGKRAAEKRRGNGSDSQQSPPSPLHGDSLQSPTPSDCINHLGGDSRAKMVINELPNGDSQRLHDRPSLPSLVIQKSVKSISPDGSPTDRKQHATDDADDSSDSDESLRQKDEKFRDECLRQSGQMMDEFHEWRDEPTSPRPRKRGQKPSEAKELFDSLTADASSQIATLTGGRKDGFETYLDLEKALSSIPDNERTVFEALWLENGELLARSRTYADVEYILGLSTQNVRTLERLAIQKLKPALGPSFFKRRSSVN